MVEPPLRVPVPKVVAPSLKVTVPEGVPTPGETAATVAVKMTGWPDTEGLGEAATPPEPRVSSPVVLCVDSTTAARNLSLNAFGRASIFPLFRVP